MESKSQRVFPRKFILQFPAQEDWVIDLHADGDVFIEFGAIADRPKNYEFLTCAEKDICLADLEKSVLDALEKESAIFYKGCKLIEQY